MHGKGLFLERKKNYTVEKKKEEKKILLNVKETTTRPMGLLEIKLKCKFC